MAFKKKEEKVAPKKDRRLVAERNLGKMKAEGYKVVGDGKDKQGKIDGVRTEMFPPDLTLMEK